MRIIFAALIAAFFISHMALAEELSKDEVLSFFNDVNKAMATEDFLSEARLAAIEKAGSLSSALAGEIFVEEIILSIQKVLDKKIELIAREYSFKDKQKFFEKTTKFIGDEEIKRAENTLGLTAIKLVINVLSSQELNMKIPEKYRETYGKKLDLLKDMALEAEEISKESLPQE